MKIREALATFRGHRIPNVDFMGRKRWGFLLSGIFIVLSLFGLIVLKLQFSIAFTGGSLLQFQNTSGSTVADYQTVMADFGRPDAQVEILGSSQVNIRTDSLTELGLRADELREALAKQAGIGTEDINEQDVGATWGSTISEKMLTGLIVFLLLVTLYISLRFEWKMALGGLAALGHDLIITAGVYSLVGREVTPETVIAILTILGYSLYDTVVIFDKVKENTESAALVARDTYSGVVNLSLNQTLMRSVNTSLVVLLPIGALLFFGGQTLKDFAFALFVGVASGAYSSVFIASPLLAFLKEREPRYQQIRARATARAARPGLRAVAPGRAATPSETGRELEPAAVTAAAARDRTAGGDFARPRPAGTRPAAKKKKGKPQGKPKRRRR